MSGAVVTVKGSSFKYTKGETRKALTAALV